MEATTCACALRPSQNVSIHASVMEATLARPAIVDQQHVSIHASVMEATRLPWCYPPRRNRFDPRLRDGGDRGGGGNAGTSKRFDPRLRDGGDAPLALRYRPICCFDPRLRDGGDVTGPPWPTRCTVSIHASVMEATQDRRDVGRRLLVSIHASVMEATA